MAKQFVGTENPKTAKAEAIKKFWTNREQKLENYLKNACEIPDNSPDEPNYHIVVVTKEERLLHQLQQTRHFIISLPAVLQNVNHGKLIKHINSYHGIHCNSIIVQSVKFDCDADSNSQLSEFCTIINNPKFLEDLVAQKIVSQLEPTRKVDIAPVNVPFSVVQEALRKELIESAWNIYPPNEIKPHEINRPYAYAKDFGRRLRTSIGVYSSFGWRFVNTRFRAMNFDGSYLRDTTIMPSTDHWDSYGWKCKDLLMLDVPESLHKGLLLAHTGQTVCRKLAFDPVGINIAGHRLF